MPWVQFANDVEAIGQAIWTFLLSVPGWVWSVAEGGTAGAAVSEGVRIYEKRRHALMERLKGCRTVIAGIIGGAASQSGRNPYGGTPPLNPAVFVELWPPYRIGTDFSAPEIRESLRTRALSHLSDPHYGCAATYLRRAEESLYNDNRALHDLARLIDTRLNQLVPGDEWPNSAPSGDLPIYNDITMKKRLFDAISRNPLLGDTEIRRPKTDDRLGVQLWFTSESGMFVAHWDEAHVTALKASVKAALSDPDLLENVQTYRTIFAHGSDDENLHTFEKLRSQAHAELTLPYADLPIYGRCVGCEVPHGFSRLFRRWRALPAP